MLLAPPPKPLLFVELVPQRRLPSSASHTGPTRIFSPIFSSTLPYDSSGGDDRSATSSPKSKVDSAVGALRGSEVLLAMQRAVARKEDGGGRGQTIARKGKKRRESKSTDVMEHLLPEDYDYRSVRPIDIRSDWGPRIDEFERRIQEIRSRFSFIIQLVRKASKRATVISEKIRSPNHVKAFLTKLDQKWGLG